MHNEQQPTNLIPINPNLRMTSLEVAELTEKQHLHIMRDVRNLIEQEAIGQSNFGLSSYVNSQNKEQPMYSLDFEATMTLITGYDAKRRNLVIKRWLALERGEAAPALASNSALDAMVGQVIQMVRRGIRKMLTNLQIIGYALLVTAKSVAGFGSPNHRRTHRHHLNTGGFFVSTAWLTLGRVRQGAARLAVPVFGLPTCLTCPFSFGSGEGFNLFPNTGGAPCTN